MFVNNLKNSKNGVDLVDLKLCLTQNNIPEEANKYESAMLQIYNQ
jgi:hypothetical protein